MAAYIERSTIKLLPIVYVVLFGVLMYVSSVIFPGFAFELEYSLFIALGVFLFGVAIVALGGLQFRRASTTVNPFTPEKTSSLVVTGIYRFSRNPMYVGFFLFLLAISILIANVVTLVFLPLFVLTINRFQIRPEEQVLETIFGDEYRQYLKSVRRWI